METIVLSLQIVIVVICLITICVIFLYQWSLFATRAPFVEIPQEILPNIVKAMDVKPGSVVYDLGSGDGRVLEACYQAEPEAKYIGIDKALVPYLLAKWKMRKLMKTADINFLHKNFFKHDFKDATHIYLYLFPGLLKSLLPKLQRELRPGAKIISCDFVFPDIEPIEVIDLNRPKGKRGRKIYVYQMG
jgi:SAM-dependent methyltransferase